jgi:hypothetical protein
VASACWSIASAHHGWLTARKPAEAGLGPDHGDSWKRQHRAGSYGTWLNR